MTRAAGREAVAGSYTSSSEKDSQSHPLLGLMLAAATLAASCGSDAEPATDSGRPTIVVTTSVWGDIVDEAFGDVADVEVIIPPGADPHDFAPSARQAERMEDADLVVVNGIGLEAGMAAVIESVERVGTPVVALADGVPVVESDSGGDDPHIWLDPTRVITAVEALGDALVAETALDRSTVDAAVSSATADLEALDADIESALASIPADRRLLVTNHDSFAYFAERYGFDVVGAVIPSNSTNASASASDLVTLADRIRELGVPAVFAESTASDRLARSLADEAGGDVTVVVLFGGSLGEPGSGAETYAGLMTSNAELIRVALT